MGIVIEIRKELVKERVSIETKRDRIFIGTMNVNKKKEGFWEFIWGGMR